MAHFNFFVIWIGWQNKNKIELQKMQRSSIAQSQNVSICHKFYTTHYHEGIGKLTSPNCIYYSDEMSFQPNSSLYWMSFVSSNILFCFHVVTRIQFFWLLWNMCTNQPYPTMISIVVTSFSKVRVLFPCEFFIFCYRDSWNQTQN